MKKTNFSDHEYSLLKRKTKREEYLECMDEIMPWDEIVAIIEPYYYNKVGRKARDIETMFRMFLLQSWYSLPDEVFFALKREIVFQIQEQSSGR